MAIVRGSGVALPEGHAGPYTFYIREGELNMRQTASKRAKGQPSKRAMEVRMKFNNPKLVWRAIGGDDKPSFETRRPGETDYNAFCRENKTRSQVFLTKDESESGACVAFPARLSNGTLEPAIGYAVEGQSVVTDIALGDLVIDEDTTVGEFSQAVYLNNEKFEYGDTIGCFIFTQAYQSVTDYPKVEVTASRVLLDEKDQQKLWQVAKREGFSSVDGYLGTGLVANSYFGWTWNRVDRLGRKLNSTQDMIGENSILPGYQTQEAFEKASLTYGGYKNQFLNPASNEVRKHSTSQGGPDPTVEYTVTCSVNGTGGTVSPASQTVRSGQQVTFTATPDSGKRVRQWSTGSTGNTLTVTVTGNKAYTVTFEDVSQGGGGSLELGRKRARKAK